MSPALRAALARLSSEHGILLALVLLCLYFSAATYAEQRPEGAAGGSQLAREMLGTLPRGASVLIAVRAGAEDAAFADVLRRALEKAGIRVIRKVQGEPANARRALEQIAAAGQRLDAVACTPASAAWAVFDNLAARGPAFASTRLMAPRPHRFPSFLKGENLLNIANQIAVIAIIAIGMTMVVITGGIDLSVGSLIALSAVVSALVIRDLFGAEAAGAPGMVMACLAGIALCGGMGLLSGLLHTLFAVPPFIATLGMMLVASGLAFMIARGQSIYQVPDSFVWLGRGADLGLPNAVVLMLALYAGAHVFMARTRWGRHLYAVGANREAARLSGVPVRRTLLFAYAVSGLLAGLGGVVMASQLRSGAPTYGAMYELYVIAAVVVGGTSLSGGQGRVIGTLLGALLIAVIQNGMNLTGVESYTQKVVLGLVILGAVLLDMLKHRRAPA